MFTYSKYRNRRQGHRRFVVFVVVALGSISLILGLFSCLKRHEEGAISADDSGRAEEWNQFAAEMEYRLLQTELLLARSDQPYLVFNLPKARLELRLKAAVVWEYPLDIAVEDSARLDKFVSDFIGDRRRLARPLIEKHLFASETQMPDSVLAIISEATKFDAELMRRDLPARFLLLWQNGVSLDVRTELSGKPASRLKNVYVEFKRLLTRPLGGTSLVLTMSKEEALTLYRTALPGLPTIVIPA